MKFITTFSIISVLALPLAFGRSTKSALSISSGHYHTCALEQRQGVEVSGALRCWGQDSLGQASPPPGIFKQVSSGSLLSCAIGLNSKVKCWGQIGGTPSNQGFSQISAGKSHACGLTTTGRIECWGRGDNGETNATQEQYTQVSCGSSNTCGLRLDGFVDCWGKFYGVGETVPPKNKFKQISVGSKQRACGITMHGDVECWGPSERTDLRGTREGPFIQVSTGSKGACALRLNRTAECWGQLRSLIPTNSTIEYEEISLGVDHACGINVDLNVQCWHRGPNLGAQEVPLGFSVAM